MKLPNFLHKPLAKYVFKTTDERVLKVVAAAKNGTTQPSTLINKEAETMAAKTLNEWKMALLLATDPEEPSRVELHKLYQNLKLDAHLVALFENRTEPIQGAAFKLVNTNGEEDVEAKKLFETLWFIEFVGYCMNSKWEGTKVIELTTLDANLHLKTINEIPMSHILPHKGLITKDAGGTSGWNYKKGALANYYIQIGKDNFLGLLAQIAPLVLGKKLGFGSWLDYIEKYGVPPIFAITDREDQQRMDQLFEALMNFKSNNFMVGRGQEEFTIGKDGGSDAFNTFDKLIERYNSELSKRINGATGTTDEKAHVGAAQVHADVLSAKHKLDKFFVKVIINNQLIPRLVNISPVYAPLQNLTFEWDDTESLNLKETLNAVKDLSAFYTFDIKALEQRTGLPILHEKNTNTTQPPTAPTIKKKS